MGKEIEGSKMQVTFKTMESGTFTLEVGESDAVEDLVTRVEDQLGRENLYRLIYAGKVMKEEELVSNLGMNGKLPVVVMMTGPSQNRREAEEGEVKMKRVRTVTEFNFLRVLVLQQPNLLQPLLLSFGQSHPEVMEAINTHKEQFVAMLYEQTGGATNKYARHH